MFFYDLAGHQAFPSVFPLRNEKKVVRWCVVCVFYYCSLVGPPLDENIFYLGKGRVMRWRLLKLGDGYE